MFSIWLYDIIWSQRCMNLSWGRFAKGSSIKLIGHIGNGWHYSHSYCNCLPKERNLCYCLLCVEYIYVKNWMRLKVLQDIGHFIRSVVRLDIFIFMVFDKCLTIFINQYLLRWPEFYISFLLVFFSANGTIFSVIFLHNHLEKHDFKKISITL